MRRGFVSAIGRCSLAVILMFAFAVLRTAADGLDNWTAGNSGVTNDLTCVTYGDGLFVAGGKGVILRSTNGLDWIPAATVFPLADGAPIVLAAIGFGNGLFVAADASSGYRIWKSTDAAHWEIVMQNLIVPESIAYGDGKFVLGGCPNGGNTAYSFDGSAWTRTYGMGSFDYIKAVAYGNGKFVAGGYPVPAPSPSTHSALWQSTNGITWSHVIEAPVQNVVYGSGKFLVYISGTPSDSVDAVVAPDIRIVSHSVAAFGGGIFLSHPSGSQILGRTVDGVWTPHFFPAGIFETNAPSFWCFGAGRFLGVGAKGRVARSGTFASRLNIPQSVADGIFPISGTAPGVQSAVLEWSTNSTAWSSLKTVPVDQDLIQTNLPISALGGRAYFRLRTAN